MRPSLPVFLIPALLWQSASPAPADTHALLVGVSTYSRSEALRRQGIAAPDLPSAANDVELVKRLLARLANGEAQCKVLRDEQATYDNVMAELTRLAERARPGDAVVVYFTLHGASIYEGGKLKARALLLWDQELPGKALRHRFGAIPARDKTLIIDSCFAAGADKGIHGAGEPVAKSLVIHREPSESAADPEFLESLTRPAEGEKGFGDDRPYTVLAACPEAVAAYAAPFASGSGSKRWLSAFTLALYRSLFLEPVEPDSLERALQTSTAELLRPLQVNQQPVALGKRPDANSLLAGSTRAPLIAERAPGPDRWTIPTGLAADIGPGSVFRVAGLPALRQAGNRKVRLEVDSAEWFSSQASVTQGKLTGSRHRVEFVAGRLPAPQPARHARKGADLLAQLPRDPDALEARWLKPTWQIGERMEFEIMPGREGWLSLILVSEDGLQLALPTSQRPARRVGAKEIVTDATLGINLTATPPAGKEHLAAILTKEPPRWPVRLTHPVTDLTEVPDEALRRLLADAVAAIAEAEVGQ